MVLSFSLFDLFSDSIVLWTLLLHQLSQVHYLLFTYVIYCRLMCFELLDAFLSIHFGVDLFLKFFDVLFEAYTGLNSFSHCLRHIRDVCFIDQGLGKIRQLLPHFLYLLLLMLVMKCLMLNSFEEVFEGSTDYWLDVDPLWIRIQSVFNDR